MQFIWPVNTDKMRFNALVTSSKLPRIYYHVTSSKPPHIYHHVAACKLPCIYHLTSSKLPRIYVLKHWIVFCRCSRAIWIASERKANWKFAFLSDAIHMDREHRQNTIQYLYLHLFTTKFVAVLLTWTQKCHISQISNVQKVRHLEQPAPDGRRTEQSRPVIQCK